jgi:hypothetical protein
VKVRFAAVLIDARHPAFEDREIAFGGVGVGVTANPFFGSMINRFVARELPADRAVHMRLIGAEMAGGVGVFENDLADLASGNSLDLDRARLTATLNQRDDLPLVVGGAFPFPATLGMQAPSRATLKDAPGRSRLPLASCPRRRAARPPLRPARRPVRALVIGKTTSSRSRAADPMRFPTYSGRRSATRGKGQVGARGLRSLAFRLSRQVYASPN